MRVNRTAFLVAVALLAGCSSPDEDGPIKCELLCETEVSCHGGEDPQGVRDSCVQWCEAQSAEPRCEAQWASFSTCVQSIEEDFPCSMDEGTTLFSVPGCEQETAEYEACDWYATNFCGKQCAGLELECSWDDHDNCLLSCYEQAAACHLGGQFTSFSYSCESENLSTGGGGFTCEKVMQ